MRLGEKWWGGGGGVNTVKILCGAFGPRKKTKEDTSKKPSREKGNNKSKRQGRSHCEGLMGLGSRAYRQRAVPHAGNSEYQVRAGAEEKCSHRGSSKARGSAGFPPMLYAQ